MPTTSSQIQQIARALNSVETAGQVRVAIGEALNAIGRTYPLLEDLHESIEGASRNELDQARVALEEWYRRISARGSEPYRSEWLKHRKLVDRAYVVVAGIEGAASYVPRTSNFEILATSLREAPAVFGKAVGEVAKEAGNVAGAAAGGLLGGLGPGGVLVLALALVLAFLVLRKGAFPL